MKNIKVVAQFDGIEWSCLDLVNFQEYDFETQVQMYSKLSSLLHGIFVNPDAIGNVILDKPQIMFLHGVRYIRLDKEETSEFDKVLDELVKHENNEQIT